MPDHEPYQPPVTQLRHRKSLTPATAEQRKAAAEARAYARANDPIQTPTDRERAILMAEVNEVLVLKGRSVGSAITTEEVLSLAISLNLPLMITEYEGVLARIAEEVAKAGG